jgi:hypothetical protein
MPRTLFVILDREHIGEVMRGERHELPVHDPAPVGAKVALKVAAHRRPTVTVEVTDCQPDDEGHTLTVRTIPLDHEPRLLAADSSRGYVDFPARALPDEPEAIEEWRQDQYTMRAIGRHVKRRRKDSLAAQRDRELRDVLDRIDQAMQAAKSNHMDVRDDLRAVRRMHAQGKTVAAVQLLREVEHRAHRDELRDAA